MLDLQTKLDRKMMQTIYEKGFSRIPIYDEDRSDIVGILMTKDLILMNPDRDNPTIEHISQILRHPKQIDENVNALDCLDVFLQH
jgi:metal transporter CNNM